MASPPEPRINEHGFVVTQHHKVTAILPNGSKDDCVSALDRAKVDLSEVDFLDGDDGARILDFDGTEHGSWGRVVRSVQKLGTASNERENYASALGDGGLVVAVPVQDFDEARTVGRVLYDCEGRRILYFARSTVEVLGY